MESTQQSASAVFMVRPGRFTFNPEAALDNVFQQQSTLDATILHHTVLKEFDNVVDTLISCGITVHVYQDLDEPHKPDAIFPNNWISLHSNGEVLLYPMCHPNRRLERRPDIIDDLRTRYVITNVTDFSEKEQTGTYLEGTGSIIFDHINRRAYGSLSKRTDLQLLEHVASYLGYRTISFRSYDEQGLPIYHTNVMMCIGTNFAVVCLECIQDPEERRTVKKSLEKTGHTMVDITVKQVRNFAGNMLTLRPRGTVAIERELLVMSQNAFDSLTSEQMEVLHKYCKIVTVSIPIIEKIGGGGVRCMLAEIFLPTM
ncbi:hypothetical protein RvY_15787 [Ramazzottius varieornatus]|uniref:Amidinotransferase n=1 Tax=Ramazzottius varieornatus TaxID=947166 RepID=A0A1D1VW59_RAMVA|nr:hypothetical protein RvY_15787 [Ramazzottius varieornatus]